MPNFPAEKSAKCLPENASFPLMQATVKALRSLG